MAGRLIPSNRHWWTWMVLGGDPEAEELQGALQGDAWLVMSGALGCYSGLAGQAKLIYISRQILGAQVSDTNIECTSIG